MRAKYEEQLVAAALGRRGLVLDPAPDGKLVERIVIEANKVILPGDFPLSRYLPWTFLNVFHMKTRDYIIAQELLFREGDSYRTDLVEESGRNLRSLFILAVARIVAARGSAPDRVVVVVVTKDQWSLRLNSSFTLDQGRFDRLGFSLTEHNLLGRNKALAVHFSFDPGRFIVGASYSDPRIWSTRYQLGLGGYVHVSRESGQAEGGSASLVFGRPLFSLRTLWSWELNFSFRQEKVRDFKGPVLRELCYAPGQALRFPTEQRPCGDGDERVPRIYGLRQIYASAALVRSFGVLNKVNLSAGFRVFSNLSYVTEDLPAGLSDGARRALIAQGAPRSEGGSGPYVALTAFRAEFVRLKNVNTFALTEDFRVGPTVELEARYADPNFGFRSRFVTLSGSYRHLFFFRDDLLTLAASGSLRWQEGVYPGSSWVNQEVSASLRNVSPRFGPAGIFRLHLYGLLRLRAHDLNNITFSLGLDSGLRGYEARALAGRAQYQVNAELRTKALNLWTIHVGGVLFYDGGDAPERLEVGAWHQAVGVGLRILLPQFNRDVLRLDLGFPLEGPLAGTYTPRFSAEFGQAF